MARDWTEKTLLLVLVYGNSLLLLHKYIHTIYLFSLSRLGLNIHQPLKIHYVGKFETIEN